MRVVLSFVVATTLAAAAVAGCGDDGSGGGGRAAGGPRIVATSSIVGDVVEHVVGDLADVEVLMPRGADPHEFQVSTRQAERMADADLLVINGAGFEAGLDDAIDAAARHGVRTYAFTDHVRLRTLDGGPDPHIWTDPDNIAANIAPLTEALVDLGLDAAALERRAARYEQDLRRLAGEIDSELADIPAARRKLVTNHAVFGYFADRFGFEVVGTIIPSLTTGAEASAADVDALAGTIEDAGVPAIFADTSSPNRLADALADAVGDEVQVVALHTESLGEEGSGAATYIEMMRTDARRIHDALA